MLRFWDKYPYTDFHEMNLSWLLDMMKSLGLDVKDLAEKLESFEGDVKAQLEYLENWIKNYDTSFAISVIEKYLATMIFVEINDAGYVTYYIPDTWDEIQFNTTGIDISVPDVDYGHLVLSY